MKKKIFALAALAFLLAGCAKSSNGDAQSTAAVESGSEADSASEAQSEVVENALTNEELAEFAQLFWTCEYSGFLDDGFNSPKDIEWEDVFQNGAGINVENISEDEKEAYLEATHQDCLYDIDTFIVIRKTDMMNFTKKHAGYEYAPDKDDLDTWGDDYNHWIYLEKYDSYYFMNVCWKELKYCSCVSGEKEGNVYTIRFKMATDDHYGKDADRVLKFTKENDELVMISNEIQWDDLCVKDKTFDANLTQFDSPLRFYTYNVDPEETELEIVKDGKYLTTIRYYVKASDDAQYPVIIDDIGFFDFNADGYQDIAVLCISYCGKKIILHEYDYESNGFCGIAELDEENVPELKGNLTIAGAKKYLLGDNENGVYNNYKEVYAQMAKIYHVADDGYKFDLAYTDDDDIPEFVIGRPGYWVSLFAYEDGHIHRLIDGWAYGAGANSGYYYAERKNVFINDNSDYNVHYTSFMSKRDKGEIATDYYIKYIYFKDLDGDGNPSEEELAASDGDDCFVEYHNNTDKKMSEKEIKKITTKYSKYDYKELCGDMDYETLLAELSK
ncbi:hypothetical protein [Butyrivibrio hungatei]|uniref:hypothetical protein n=1 Tax=Butyrivibrio hungatei TaxID=185008 RepID=UPI000428F7E4|nr:hypothetical protein [Butyrivibrio hungatei]